MNKKKNKNNFFSCSKSAKWLVLIKTCSKLKKMANYYDMFKVSNMTYDLFKVSKMTTKFFDLFKVSKMTNYYDFFKVSCA